MAKKAKCKVEIYKTKSKGKVQWKWRLISSNNRAIIDPIGTYSKRSNLMRALDTVKAGMNSYVIIEEE